MIPNLKHFTIAFETTKVVDSASAVEFLCTQITRDGEAWRVFAHFYDGHIAQIAVFDTRDEASSYIEMLEGSEALLGRMHIRV